MASCAFLRVAVVRGRLNGAGQGFGVSRPLWCSRVAPRAAGPLWYSRGAPHRLNADGPVVVGLGRLGGCRSALEAPRANTHHPSCTGPQHWGVLRPDSEQHAPQFWSGRPLGCLISDFGPTIPVNAPRVRPRRTELGRPDGNCCGQKRLTPGAAGTGVSYRNRSPDRPQRLRTAPCRRPSPLHKRRQPPATSIPEARQGR